MAARPEAEIDQDTDLLTRVENALRANYDVAITVLVAAIVFSLAKTLYSTPSIIRDAYSYTMAAQRLVHDGYLAFDSGALPGSGVPPDARVTPFYIFFLAIFYALLGHGGDAVAAAKHVQPILVAAQSLLSVGTVALLALCGRELGGKRLGLLSGVLAACYLPFIWAASVSLSETLAMPLIALELLVALKLTSSRRLPTWKELLAFGILSGVLGLTRPSMIAWFAIPLIYLALRRFSEWRQVLPLLAVAVLGFLLILAPWWVRNEHVSGKFVPIRTDEIRASTGGGYQSIGTEGAAPPASNQEKLGQVQAGLTTPWSAPDDVLWDNNFNRAEQRVDVSLFPVETHSRLAPWLDVMFYYQVALLAFAVVALFFSAVVPRLLVVASMPVYVVLVHVNVQVISRYTFLAMPAVIVLAAAGLFGLARLASRTFRRLSAG